MLKAISFLRLISIAPLVRAAPNDETQVWNLEKSYWEYVKANDLEKYRTLWHEQFLGWPSSSATPLGKEHITDWITRNTSKGVTLQSYEIEQLAMRATGDIAVAHYRINLQWTGPKPTDNETENLRIHHTWIRTGDTFQIIAGMSAPVNAEGK